MQKIEQLPKESLEFTIDCCLEYKYDTNILLRIILFLQFTLTCNQNASI